MILISRGSNSRGIETLQSFSHQCVGFKALPVLALLMNLAMEKPAKGTILLMFDYYRHEEDLSLESIFHFYI